VTVTTVKKDPETRTLTISAQFDAPVARVWQVWDDPRQLERWSGPPTYPATVLDHDLTPGGSVTYLMTGPGGDKHRGWWRVIAVDAPHRLEFEDGFADDAADHDVPRHPPRASRGWHTHGDRVDLPRLAGHAAADRDGHGRGHDGRGRADRSAAHTAGSLTGVRAAGQGPGKVPMSGR
jgi:uncharacterized protein YndB with AHSA1/START domain